MTKLFLTEEKDRYDEIVLLLGYKKEKEKKSLIPGYTSIKYSKSKNIKVKDATISNYMPKSHIPFFFVILVIALAFILATTFLILILVNKDSSDRLVLFFSLMLPAFLCLLTATGLTFLRYYVTLRNLRCLASKALIVKEIENL